jgi:hypothetical protein
MAFSTWLAYLLAALLIAVSPGPGAATSWPFPGGTDFNSQ